MSGVRWVDSGDSAVVTLNGICRNLLINAVEAATLKSIELGKNDTE